MNFLKNKGFFYGMFSGFTWALDTVLIGFVLSQTLFLSTAEIIFLAPLISTFLHDALSSVWMMLFLGFRGELKTALSKVTTRSGRFVLLGAFLGGPIGMTFYVLAVKYLGAGMAASISAVYPAVGALFAFLLIKDRLSFKNWVGLFISILFIFLMGYSGGAFDSPNIVLGFIFILICVFGWGMECVILAYGMKDDEISPEHALQLRQLLSAVTYAIVILPVFGGYKFLGTVVMSPEMLWIALIALFGTLSYVYYYKAIYTLGPTRAMALNITYASWSIILGFLIFGSPITAKIMFFSLMIIIGSVITVAKPEELSIKRWIGKGAA
ncbi:DMT family transporter [Bacillus timonensis]|nr:DMT family transporter [Bacillus timonensis]